MHYITKEIFCRTFLKLQTRMIKCFPTFRCFQEKRENSITWGKISWPQKWFSRHKNPGCIPYKLERFKEKVCVLLKIKRQNSKSRQGCYKIPWLFADCYKPCSYINFFCYARNIRFGQFPVLKKTNILRRHEILPLVV